MKNRRQKDRRQGERRGCYVEPRRFERRDGYERRIENRRS
jgi:hypothetical protein